MMRAVTASRQGGSATTTRRPGDTIEHRAATTAEWAGYSASLIQRHASLSTVAL